MGVAQGLWILHERTPKIILYKTILGAITCIFGNIILIPKLGLIAVPMIAVLAQIVTGFLSNIYFDRRIFYLQSKSIVWPAIKFNS